MAPPFSRASIQLDYPPCAVQFDPEDANRLIVGGGGGATRSGQGNKITVLETDSKQELCKAGELVLSRDEDNVASLAIGAHMGKSTYLYAGVNSSPADIAKGRNEHLRTLTMEQSRSRASVGTKIPEVKIAEVGRRSLFVDENPSTYQRLLRVAGPMAAAATDLGKESQLAVFEAAGPTIKIRGVMEMPERAVDLDIIQLGENEWQVAYCHKYELHVVNIGKETSEPELMFTMPDDHGERPTLRSIRYLSPKFILAATDLPDKGGILLQGLRLPSPGQDKARFAATVRVPGKGFSTGLAVANLSPPASPGAPQGDAQFVVAVAGSDCSISLYTVIHQSSGSIDLLVNLHQLYTLKGVQSDISIVGLAFSQFTTPKTHIREQSIKLASISLTQTVAVHTIPLKKYTDRTPRNPKGPPRPVRYVVKLESRPPTNRSLFIVLTIMALIMAIVGQIIMEVYGQGMPIFGVQKTFPSWHGTLRSFDPQPAAFLEDEFIHKLAGAKRPSGGETLVMWEAEQPPLTAEAGSGGEEVSTKKFNVDVHDEAIHGPGKAWHELADEQKEAWKDKLLEAGAWTQGMGESVFKGILFGEMAGAVGRAVAG